MSLKYEFAKEAREGKERLEAQVSDTNVYEP